ncbi:MAG: hypothetical protein EXR28_03595 [Betaproteobacteria bacterium]|nr:hypothetical protein [Betaproteobacteria bacterium]
MKTLSLKIPEQLQRRIELEVARRRIVKSVLVREALEKHLAGAQATGKKASFLDLAGDLIGKYSGPGDLSTNPKYMKDFGK